MRYRVVKMILFLGLVLALNRIADSVADLAKQVGKLGNGQQTVHIICEGCR